MGQSTAGRQLAGPSRCVKRAVVCWGAHTEAQGSVLAFSVDSWWVRPSPEGRNRQVFG